MSASRLWLERGDLLRLAAPDERRRVRSITTLHDAADDIGSRAVDQLGQLVELLVDHLGGEPGKYHAHEDDALSKRPLNERPGQQIAQESIPGWMSTSATLRTGPARRVVSPSAPERDLERAARVADPDRRRTVDDAPAARRRGGGHAAGATGQRLAHPALPDAEVEEVALVVLHERDPFDVDATVEGRLELGAQLGDVDRPRVGSEQHEVRVPDVDRTDPSIVELLGLVRAEPRRSHVDAGRGPTWARTDCVVDRAHPSSGGHREAGRAHQPGVHRGLGQTADAVAAHFGLSPVRVVQLHGEVGAVAPRADTDDPVGPDAATTIGQETDLGHRESETVIGIEDDEEVVARALVLRGVHPSIVAGHTAQPCTARARSTRSSASSPSLAQVMRGSRRNQAAWRRANWRVRRTASSRQASSGTPSSTWASSSL